MESRFRIKPSLDCFTPQLPTEDYDEQLKTTDFSESDVFYCECQDLYQGISYATVHGACVEKQRPYLESCPNIRPKNVSQEGKDEDVDRVPGECILNNIPQECSTCTHHIDPTIPRIRLLSWPGEGQASDDEVSICPILDLEDARNSLWKNGPLVTTFLPRDTFISVYEEGTYEPGDPEYDTPFEKNHCICIVGYEDDRNNDQDGCWICKNSWGEEWGMNGWFKIRYSDCQIGMEGYYSLFVNKNMVPERINRELVLNVPKKWPKDPMEAHKIHGQVSDKIVQSARKNIPSYSAGE
jgi:hypothetical protein